MAAQASIKSMPHRFIDEDGLLETMQTFERKAGILALGVTAFLFGILFAHQRVERELEKIDSHSAAF